MKRVFALCLAACLLVLCGCAPQETPETTPSQTQPSQTQPSQTKPSESQTPTTGATEPTGPLLYRNPLTGEPMAEETTARPFAVVLNNTKADLPQYGVGVADVVYETLIEGETRCLGIFYNLTPERAATLGTVRSARYYFIQIAQGYDAIYVHNGCSSDPEIGAKQYFEKTGWPRLDTISSPGGQTHFYNPDGGSDLTGRVVIRPESVLALAKKLKLKTERETPLDMGWQFDDDKVIIGDDANNVKVWFNISGKPSAQWHKSTSFAYNSEDKLYYASQYGSPYVDGNNGEQISFRNLLVLRTRIENKKNSQLMYVDTVGSGTGYFICNGQAVEINWSRASVTDPFVYTLAANGQPVTFGVGRTYVAFVPQKAQVEIG